MKHKSVLTLFSTSIRERVWKTPSPFPHRNILLSAPLTSTCLRPTIFHEEHTLLSFSSHANVSAISSLDIRDFLDPLPVDAYALSIWFQLRIPLAGRGVTFIDSNSCVVAWGVHGRLNPQKGSHRPCTRSSAQDLRAFSPLVLQFDSSSAVTMTTTLPRPSRPSLGPPNMALPALPVSKTRKSTGNIPNPPKSAPGTPRSGLRTPSTMSLAPPGPAPTTALPQPKLGAAASGGGKTIRKSVSINSFPQPPNGVPQSPRTLEKNRSIRKPKTPSKDSTYSSIGSSTPSFLNGSGDGKSISSVRMSDGLISVSSPPQSRSSSAQDSYSTSATTYDDPADGAAQKTEPTTDKRASKVDGKGNVLVSVRVRPDAGNSAGHTEGEWLVDGRKSLISYRGKDGGDHYYGK